MNSYLKILDYFFLARPTLFFPLWTVMLAGRYSSGSQVNIGWLFLSFASLMGTSYIVNQIFDSKTDSDNRKLFYLAEGLIPVRNAAILAGVLATGGLIGLLALGISAGIWGLLFLFLTAYCYNLPPVAWKDRPIMGLVVSALGGGIAFILGGFPNFTENFTLDVIPYLFALTAVALLTNVPDMKGDASAGKKTFLLRYGFATTRKIAFIACTLSTLSGILLRDNIILWSALLSLPLFLIINLRNEGKYIALAIKYPIFILSVMVALEYPWYFILIFGYYFFARWYYKKRFRLEYPSFKYIENEVKVQR